MDENSSLMNGFGLETFLIDAGLKSLVQELVKGQTQNVIELEFLVGKESITMHSVKKGGTFEKSSWIFLFKGKELTSSLSESGEQ